LHCLVLTSVGDIGRAHDSPDLLHGLEIGAETSVHGEDLLVNDGGNGETVEAVGESLPELDVVATLALVVESVDTVDRGALVVATEDEEVLGVLDLVCEEKTNGLERLLATVDIVTKEEVVGFWGEAAVLEETEKVVVLAVNVTTNLDGCLELEKDGLADKDLARLGAEVLDLILLQLNGLAGAVSTD
jgi:hypothetical protein